ncbi:MAG: hypothetical protein HC854_03945 [Flavobacterium sp.]|nr:hypothetical protein [Flavobacterium sp.]
MTRQDKHQNMKDKIIIKRDENQGLNILKTLSFFRDIEILHSLQEISDYMKIYEADDQVSIECNKEIIDEITKELEEENVQYNIS